MTVDSRHAPRSEVDSIVGVALEFFRQTWLRHGAEVMLFPGSEAVSVPCQMTRASRSQG